MEQTKTMPNREAAATEAEKRDIPAGEKRNIPAEEKRDIPAEKKRNAPPEEKRDIPAEKKRNATPKEKRSIPPEKKRERLSDLLVFAGVAAVAAGTAMIYLPAGVILGGLGAIWIGWQIAKGGGNG